LATVFIAPCYAQEGTQVIEALLAQAREADKAGDHRLAADLASKVIESDPRSAEAYYWRGRARFCLDKIDDSLADFDKTIELNPAGASRLWERGITCYYAGKFKEGARQFELYQTFHSEDVENAVWHILCNCRVDGFDAAAKKILPIRRDARVPMTQVYDLFRASATPADVLNAAQTASDRQSERDQTFYAHLYLGLYHDARGQHDKAEHHLKRAVELRENHYMWEVARIHWQHFKKKQAD
jgi:lipoprotein NlpI